MARRALLLLVACTAALALTGKDLELPKEHKIMKLESESSDLQERLLFPATVRWRQAQHRLEQAKKSGGWFPSEKEKTAIATAEVELHKAHAEYRDAELRVEAVHRQLKPLYGPYSPQFLTEQKEQAKKSVKVVTDFAFRSAMWDLFLGNTNSQSLSELLVELLLKVVGGMILGYPFGAIHFSWKTAWRAAEYSDGSLNGRFGALLMFVVSSVVFLLPLVCLCGGCFAVVRHNERTVARTRQERIQERPRYGKYD
eukprot:TRINITY_DN11453_c0_g1_i1.p1 TRINITY_DN11453_c0_g1~~TRINITY_DN11453_c0_g1_i1.p1  ORF type:complete len:255 (-),score=59.16 TRINITY_DN11453_c0_g1_i1:89-853(-)